VTSLRGRLLFWLLSGVLLVGALGGWFVYRNALAEADVFFDYQLRQTALLLSGQPVQYQLSPDLPDGIAGFDFVIQVWTFDGVQVYQSKPHTILPAITRIGFSNVTTNEGQWRVFGTQGLTKVIQVAQPMRVREHQAAELALRTLRPFALWLPVLVVFVWVAVGAALEPLKRVTQLVSARQVNALEPLPHEPLPDEVQPLVAALNDLLGRLNSALHRERAFIVDAAHELRTPLTALHLQMGALVRAASETERAEATERLSAGVQRAIRLVEQMLSLSRQESRADGAPASARSESVALDEVARSVVAELVPLADSKHIDLGISNSQQVVVPGDRDALCTMLRNLIDNAVRYTPEGGRVDVAVEGRAGPGTGDPEAAGGAEATGDAGATGGAVIKVVDTGPGIPVEDRTRVFDRFYRRPGTTQPGSGLGMAIVKAIADKHLATVTLDSGPGAVGLAVTVTFAAR
jgi:two-component system OmpR family sensor kinase